MLRRHMGRLVAEHGRKLVVILYRLKQARINADLIARKHKGIGFLILKHGIFPGLVASSSRSNNLMPDAAHTAV